MTSRIVFATLTGLHLAVLQFGYFFLLLTGITSTYVTYAIVAMSWMAGSIVGLLWTRLERMTTFALGVVSYYAIYFLIEADPLASVTLPLAAAGVGVTGLWAGRFFVEMLPQFGRADQLFFHENNGFVLGIVGVFVGFTLEGRPFLLFMPALTGALLLAQLTLLGAGRPRRAAARR
jgi:hypothetical protein